MNTSYTEDALVEQPALALLAELGWESMDCLSEYTGPARDAPPGALYLGRETRSEVLLSARLRPALERLNPGLPVAALDQALEVLAQDRSAMSMVAANQQVYTLLKDGVKVTFRAKDGEERTETIRMVDWETPKNNDFFLASQFWVTGEMYTRRPDLLGFVNGIPLVFIELKAPQKNVKDAYTKNLRDYKTAIPHLFWYNALLILSNGVQTRVGSLTSPWEHFSEWKKINREGEEGVISLETVLRGTCNPARLLDLAENFTLFSEAQGGLKKLFAKNHQYLGVNNAFDAVKQLRTASPRLGVFWHTQGSGKSYSMVFFAQKVLRKQPGNWTFVIITDRKELDGQIYKNFANAGAVIEPENRVRAASGEHLKQLLREDHRYVFTLIQKFRTDNGAPYPVLSKRDNIIVMTDEAHRTQYDVLALNMRTALPNAAFIGFTGTPLMAGEEQTKQVFGGYVSIYNFKQSADDGATVPLFYENRIPELQLTNAELNRDMERLLEDAELDEPQERKLEREFAREYHLITRGERLEAIAEDMVLHFMGRGHRGKAMFVAVDKATAVRMYDKVEKYWQQHQAELEAALAACDPLDRPELEAKLDYMRTTNRAVVVSQAQNEIADLAEKGADIVPHRRRMLAEDLETKFKDPTDPFRLVFVCAMWMTGFDAPACSTIYLDKPMRNHTLMQTIARANRVFGEKINGLIVDYIGVFRDLQRALAIYGSATGGGAQPGETPVLPKEELVTALRAALEETRAHLTTHGVDLDAILTAEGFARTRLLQDAHEALIPSDDAKRQYAQLTRRVDLLFKAILPDPAANDFGPARKAIVVLDEMIRANLPPADISGVMDEVENLLDQSIAPTGYVIRAETRPISESKPTDAYRVDLSQLDFEALKRQFEHGRKRIEAEKLRGMINAKLRRMVRVNKSRLDYYEKFQEMIDDYNAGSSDVDALFAQLLTLAQDLNAEEQRGIAEQLDEEQLALFDLLTRPKVKLTPKERERVKALVREMLDTLKAERLVLQWRKKQRSRAAVRVTIRKTLLKLPETYNTPLYQKKTEEVYQHIYESYYGAGRSVYGVVK